MYGRLEHQLGIISWRFLEFFLLTAKLWLVTQNLEVS